VRPWRSVGARSSKLCQPRAWSGTPGPCGRQRPAIASRCIRTSKRSYASAVSNSGLRVPDWSQLGRETLLDTLRAAPHVCAALNGHDHWDEVNTLDRLRFIQNAAFVEWPNTFRVYRVYRVYRDRLDWEVRQVGNRGFVRESFRPVKAVSWIIATGDDDRRGSVSLARRG
jgi:hypothetical protein